MPQFVAYTKDIPEGSSRKIKLKNGEETQEGFVIRQNNRFFAYWNRCPHISLPLDWGSEDFLTSDGKYSICRNHGALFQIETGECVDGPCVGESLEKIPLKVVGNKIMICPY